MASCSTAIGPSGVAMRVPGQKQVTLIASPPLASVVTLKAAEVKVPVAKVRLAATLAPLSTFRMPPAAPEFWAQTAVSALVTPRRMRVSVGPKPLRVPRLVGLNGVSRISASLLPSKLILGVAPPEAMLLASSSVPVPIDWPELALRPRLKSTTLIASGALIISVPPLISLMKMALVAWPLKLLRSTVPALSATFRLPG